MEGLVKLCFSLALLFLFVDLALSADSPAPAPSPPEGQVLQPPASPLNAFASQPSSSRTPASSPTLAPPPALGSPPAPLPFEGNDAPSSLSSATKLTAADEDLHANENQNEKSESGGGLKRGQKVGIAIGVIVGADIVGLGGFVYKKWRDNICRSKAHLFNPKKLRQTQHRI